MEWHEYADSEMMMMTLARLLARDLRSALARRERAVLCVPGGTTPGPVFDMLAAVDLDWERVDIVLSDERWVPEDHPRSNAALVRARLLQGRAAEARLVPFYLPGTRPEDTLPALNAALEGVLPVDVALLGMGEDLHTASMFPGTEGLDQALAADAPPIMVMHPQDQPEPRLTLTMPVLTQAFALHIVITGAAKRAALERAQGLDPMEAPVAALLSQAEVHWAQ